VLGVERTVRIPFDSLTLAAVVDEIRPWIGARVQGVRQPDETTLTLELYLAGQTAMLLVSWNPEAARVHFTSRRRPSPPSPPAFCAAVRAAIDGGRLQAMEQAPFDRLLTLEFSTEEGTHRLVVEPMGRHANVMLLDPTGKIRAWGRRPGRVLHLGHAYAPPVGVGTGTDYGGPFLAKLRASGAAVVPGTWSPVLSIGVGAYPVSVAALGLREVGRGSISVGLDSHFSESLERDRTERIRHAIRQRLERVLSIRETALHDIAATVVAGGRSAQWQRYGELILAYGFSAPTGSRELEAWDYDGSPVTIPLDPEKSPKDNAESYFSRAKRAKHAAISTLENRDRLEADRVRLQGFLPLVDAAKTVDQLDELAAEARRRRWMMPQSAAKASEDRPYEGHRVREYVAPGGVLVLVGENAESNDYLTMRVARANDYWLHVRGGTSAHVVIRTNNQPGRIGPEHLRFAAQLAARNSALKHSKFVAVDYTLKKHVRKPKGAPAGTVTYSHEKTLHVEEATV